MADHLGNASSRHHKRPIRRMFGVSDSRHQAYATTALPASFNPYDYEIKYPEDPHAEEAGPNARVWWTYLDVAEEFDLEQVEGWKDTIDLTMIFAGLFSAVVTGFLAQAWQNARNDYTEESAKLLYQSIQLQIALANGISPASLPPVTPPPPSSHLSISAVNRGVNALWFASLCLSLSTAVIAMLTKQWLHWYTSTVSGTPRERAMIRQLRWDGLKTWKVHMIIDTLPIIMHSSLALFLIGLVFFLLPFNRELVWIAGSITAGTFTFYIASVLSPLFNVKCPYQTTLSRSLYALIKSITSSYKDRHQSSHYGSSPTTLAQLELQEVADTPLSYQASALNWLWTSSNMSAQSIILECLGGFSDKGSPRVPFHIHQHHIDATIAITHSDQEETHELGLRKLERLSRGLLAGYGGTKHLSHGALPLGSSSMSYFFSGCGGDEHSTPVHNQLRILQHLHSVEASKGSHLTARRADVLNGHGEALTFLLHLLAGDYSSVYQHPSVWTALLKSTSQSPLHRRDASHVHLVRVMFDILLNGHSDLPGTLPSHRALPNRSIPLRFLLKSNCQLLFNYLMQSLKPAEGQRLARSGWDVGWKYDPQSLWEIGWRYDPHMLQQAIYGWLFIDGDTAQHQYTEDCLHLLMHCCPPDPESSSSDSEVSYLRTNRLLISIVDSARFNDRDPSWKAWSWALDRCGRDLSPSHEMVSNMLHLIRGMSEATALGSNGHYALALSSTIFQILTDYLSLGDPVVINVLVNSQFIELLNDWWDNSRKIGLDRLSAWTVCNDSLWRCFYQIACSFSNSSVWSDYLFQIPHISFICTTAVECALATHREQGLEICHLLIQRKQADPSWQTVVRDSIETLYTMSTGRKRDKVSQWFAQLEGSDDTSSEYSFTMSTSWEKAEILQPQTVTQSVGPPRATQHDAIIMPRIEVKQYVDINSSSTVVGADDDVPLLHNLDSQSSTSVTTISKTAKEGFWWNSGSA